MNTITLSVNTSGLIHNLKAMFSDRFKVISELIQNARRAQSGIVELTLEGSDLHIRDYGVGIANFGDLLTVAQSGWTGSALGENPYGMGFLSTLFSCESITVHSNAQSFTANCDSIINGMSVTVVDAPAIQGCRITLHNIGPSMLTPLDLNIRSVAKAQDIAVIWNGEELARPYTKEAMLADGRKCVPFGLGNIYIRPGIFNRHYVAFLQGCHLKGFGDDSQDAVPAVIYNDNVLARVPDRDSLIDHGIIKDVTDKALLVALRESLFELRSQTANDELFVKLHSKAIRELALTMFNEIDILPAQGVSYLTEYTTKDSSGFERSYCSVRRNELKGKYRIDSEVFDEFRYEYNLSYLMSTYLSQVDGLFELNSTYDSEHWVYSETQSVPLFSSGDINLELVNAKEPFFYESDILCKTPVVLCDRIVMDGPLGRFETDSMAFFDGKQIVVPAKCVNGNVVGQLCSFMDEWGVVDDEQLWTETEGLHSAIVRHRVQCPGQRLTMLLNAMLPGSELESFANRTFTVQFGKDGELTVSAA